MAETANQTGDKVSASQAEFTQLLANLGASPAAPQPAGPPPSTVDEMRAVHTALDASRPRPRQTALGPSVLGTPCPRQLAYKLAGLPRQPTGIPFSPMPGTARHGLTDEALRHHHDKLLRATCAIEVRLTS